MNQNIMSTSLIRCWFSMYLQNSSYLIRHELYKPNKVPFSIWCQHVYCYKLCDGGGSLVSGHPVSEAENMLTVSFVDVLTITLNCIW